MKENVKLGTAAHRFCNSLQKVIENYAEMLDGYIPSSCANTHGIRKGSQLTQQVAQQYLLHKFQ